MLVEFLNSSTPWNACVASTDIDSSLVGKLLKVSRGAVVSSLQLLCWHNTVPRSFWGAWEFG